MELRKVLTLRGPNIWTTHPTLEAWIILQEGELHAGLRPAVRQQLSAFCAALHGACGTACNDGVNVPFHEESFVPRLIARIATELQTVLGGQKICLARAVAGHEAGLHKIVVGYTYEEFGEACVETAYEFCAAAIRGEPFETAPALDKLRTLAAEARAATGDAAIAEACRAKNVPTLSLHGQDVVQFGWGAKQRRVVATQTDRTSAVAESIANDRDATQSLLCSVGVPVVDLDDYETEPTANYQLLVIGQQLVAAVHVDATTNQVSDVLADVHADNAAHAIEAARIIGLDVSAINIVAKEIARPLGGENGAVLDVFARPSLDIFCDVSAEAARRVGGAFVENLFPGPQNGRIPVVSITGTNGKTTTTRLVAHIVAATGKRVGMTCTDGIYINGRRIDHDDCSGPKSARNVLKNPLIDAAVLETARGGILREGTAFDRCDVAVVMNIGEGDHLGLHDVFTPEHMAVVKRTIVTAVAPGGAAVLKADDPLTAGMAAHCPGSVVFFCVNGDHPVMVKHRNEGGRVVFVRDRAIVLAEGALEIPLLSVDRIPLTHKGLVWFQVENALAATAATWSLGIPAEIIRNGLETFAAKVDQSPGRFNLLEMGGATVIVDYGHNTSSLQAMLQAIAQFPHPRRYAVYSAAGDRRDEDMVRQGEMLGEAFERVYLYEDQYTRGRQPGEIMKLFSQGLRASRRVPEIVEHQGWENAAEAALKSVRPGDLLLLQADTIDEAVELVNRHLATDVDAHEVDLKTAIEHVATPSSDAATAAKTV